MAHNTRTALILLDQSRGAELLSRDEQGKCEGNRGLREARPLCAGLVLPRAMVRVRAQVPVYVIFFLFTIYSTRGVEGMMETPLLRGYIGLVLRSQAEIHGFPQLAL